VACPLLALCEGLRNLCPHVKIIFTTPENTRDLEQEVRALGVFYYYTGEAERAELVEAVRDAVGPPGSTPHRTPPGPAPT
jgi:DNA-binding NarL/FixJ family response regulator